MKTKNHKHSNSENPRVEEQCPQWQKITEFSQQMLNATQKKDWQHLNELVPARQKLLSDYFKAGNPANGAQRLQHNIITLQSIDSEIVELMQSNQKLLAEAMSKLQKGKNMAAQYRSHTS